MIYYVGILPICTVCRISLRNSLCWARRPLVHYCKPTFRQPLCWGPTPTCIVCRNWCSNFSMLGPPD
ncbi:hypothetical protein B7R57_14115 [Staphylococcus aureus]|nr:hypothetical protein B7473_14000 [Staphylococcus aureus]AUJ58240.1 hypothetical protein B7474_13370 [Staphylococcus aureus]AUX00145.1 hypothetical protein B7R57_14115 [Staphylococcus aureus]OYN36671.1 hypothetical protein B7D92_12310 [Staphylococcus aureus]RBL74027.1 hypothetical protein B4O96_12480 [Staphylococcus aureus]